jgi:hypothetical protein
MALRAPELKGAHLAPAPFMLPANFGTVPPDIVARNPAAEESADL